MTLACARHVGHHDAYTSISTGVCSCFRRSKPAGVNCMMPPAITDEDKTRVQIISNIFIGVPKF